MKHVMVTCYDATFARICADAECFDSLLVGDSVGMVVGGHTSTTSVTLDQMIYHVGAVARGVAQSKAAKKPMIIADLPIDTYETNPVDAVQNAMKLILAGAQFVKVEGPVIDSVVAIKNAGIPVIAHIGLTPQSITAYKVQGRNPEEAERLKNEAIALEKAGASMIVFELLPAALAEELTNLLKIPTIGIGAGSKTTGQVLVLYDLLGLNPDFSPKFLKKYGNGFSFSKEALTAYANEVRGGTFPDAAHSYS